MWDFYIDIYMNLMYGVKMPRLGTSDMNSTIISIPPINEQERIVSKADFIFQLIETNC